MDRLKELHIDRNDKARKSGGGLALGALALVLVLSAGSGWWWLSRNAAAEVRLAVVEQATASPGGASATVLDASGYVTARLRATVSSKIAGKIVEVLVEEGMVIEEGQLLARLDDSTARRQLALAEAELAAAASSLAETEVLAADAERTRDRLEQLVAGAVASQARLDTARADHDALLARLDLGREQVAVAESRVDLRRQQLDDTFIRAPFDGVAVTKNAQPGEMISPNSAGGFTRTGICTLVDMSSLEIEVDVNEAYINRVRPGQRVTATLDAYPDWKMPASVIIPVPTADRQKATVMVRIAFDQLEPRILPDMGVRVSFLSEEQPASGGSPRPRLVMPEAALRRDGDSDVVYVVQGDVVERRAVRVGARQDDLAEVEAGLKAGDRVVIEGPEDLADGDRVVAKGD